MLFRSAVLAADLGATHARLELSDLGGEALGERIGEVPIAQPPEVVLKWVEDQCSSMLAEAGISAERLRAIAVGIPGPVEFSSGRPVTPPIMPGWDGYAIPERLQRRFPVPVLVDNDVNLMAIGEHALSFADSPQLLFVKVATGIGCGIILNGDIYRGADGAAGDIGHIRLLGHEDVICECGNTACLEAVAGGRAIARALVEADPGLAASVHNARDVVRLVSEYEPRAVRSVRHAGRQIGDVLAGVVNALNPGVIVIGGDLANAQEPLIAGIRETIYQRSTALATRGLQVSGSTLGERAGVVGATKLAIDHVITTGLLV